MRDTEPRRCFIDGIDWQPHLEADPQGTLLFPSERSLREIRTCLKSSGCGVVEVEVRLIRWVEPQNLKKGGLTIAEVDARFRKQDEEIRRAPELLRNAGISCVDVVPAEMARQFDRLFSRHSRIGQTAIEE